MDGAKARAIAALDARMSARGVGASTTPATDARGRPRTTETKETLETTRMRTNDDGRTTAATTTRTTGEDDADGSVDGIYAPSARARRERTVERARARATSRRRREDADDATSDDATRRRRVVENYLRRVLRTRARGDAADGEDQVRKKLGRERALTLEDAPRGRDADAETTRRERVRERFARAMRARASGTVMRKRGMFGLKKSRCSWSAFGTLRRAWTRYARGLVESRDASAARRALTKEIDLHGCVVKVTSHARQPDAVGREGVVAFVSARRLWVCARAGDDFYKVLIDGAALEYALDDRIVRLAPEDVARLARGAAR